jgi:S1-C subfamily serine protease
MRIRLHISVSAILLLFTFSSAAQDIKRLKTGVVRIKNNTSGEVGAGFIARIDEDLIYIVTASHVVKGSSNPQVLLFTAQSEPLSAELINRDDDNPRGLALLRVQSKNTQMLAKVMELDFADSSEINGGENVKIIGFPASSSFWDVSAGIISRLEGNNLIFAAPIQGGNSGGPVILSDGRVIGIVTDTTESQGTSSAPKAEVIVSYLNGIIAGLIDTTKVGSRKVTLNVSLDKIEVHQDGSAASTSWRFEISVGTQSVIPLAERGFNDRDKPVLINKNADFDVDTDRPFTLRVVGDKSEEGIQALGETTLKWQRDKTSEISLTIPVKVQKACNPPQKQGH